MPDIVEAKLLFGEDRMKKAVLNPIKIVLINVQAK
jgi:hypothetical protein